MGYYINMTDATIKMKKENVLPALTALKNYLKENYMSWVLNFTVPESLEDTDTLNNVWESIRYEFNPNGEYYELVNFNGEKMGNDFEFFQVLAPFCEDGYVEFVGEEGEYFRYVIKDHQCKEQYSQIIWDD